jgi:hypothetical protein
VKEMGIKDIITKTMEKIFGNTIDRISVRELRGEELRLKAAAQRTKEEIDKLEKEKAKLFKDGVGADRLTKKMLSEEIITRDMQAKLNLRSFITAANQLRLVKNLIVVKQYEEQLRQTKIWKQLSSIPVKNLEDKLVQVNLDGKMFDEVVSTLNDVFKMEVAEIESRATEDEVRIFDAWAQVESGKMDPEAGAKSISIEKTVEKETEK